MVRAIVHTDSREEVKLLEIGFVKHASFSQEWNREGVVYEQSGGSEGKEVMGEE